MVALHVEQRYLAHSRTEEGPALPREHIPNEQPTIRAADAPELLGHAHAALDEVARDRLEILIRFVALLTQRRLVPSRAILAAAPNVGDGLDAAALEPTDAHSARIARRQRDLEASVAVE